MIPYMQIHTNNKAFTMVSDFIRGIKKMGIPSRIRVDHGGEFVHIKSLITKLNGNEHNSWIAGKSVHNQRIERLWRDVFCKVLNKFYLVFNAMEKNEILSIENVIHMAALHHVYSRRIQQDLQLWSEAHNSHPISTERYKTPLQLWNTASILAQNERNTAMHNLFRREISQYSNVVSNYEDENSLVEPDNIEHVLPRFPLPLTNAQLINLNETIDVMKESHYEGLDIYNDTLTFIQNCQSN